MNTLMRKYREDVVPKLISEFGFANVHEAPRIERVVLNVGFGKNMGNKQVVETSGNTLQLISGQKPVPTKAKKSIASFKLREGNTIGMKVTLRSTRMYDFLSRLINIVIPRFRDFHGLPKKAFDKEGNYSIGVVDQSVFPELSYEDMPVSHGLQVNIVASGGTRESRVRMLELLGFPFERSE